MKYAAYHTARSLEMYRACLPIFSSSRQINTTLDSLKRISFTIILIRLSNVDVNGSRLFPNEIVLLLSLILYFLTEQLH